jgi:hypothetical protein
MQGNGHPVVLTINGRAELVVQDAASYQKLLDRIDELETLEGIKRGLADVEAGRVTPLREFEKSSGRSMAFQVVPDDQFQCSHNYCDIEARLWGRILRVGWHAVLSVLQQSAGGLPTRCRLPTCPTNLTVDGIK